MRSYSRRELYAAGEFLGNSATQNKVGGGRIYGGGGGGPTSSTVTQSNIPDWLRPQTEALLGAATQEYFTTKPVVGEDGKTTYEITGVKPYTPYSTNPQDYVAGFTPQQQQVFAETANMYRPEQFGMATRYADIAGQGGLDSAQQAYGYGNAGYQSGMLGQNLGIQGGAQYGQQGADIGMMGLRAEQTGNQIGAQAQDYARQAALAGQQYRQDVTNPYAVQAYMSPYQQNVTDLQTQAAMRQADIARQGRKAQAARSGAFGGARQAIEEAEANRALATQLQGIEAQGLQSAYDKAIQAQQFGANLGLQGLSGAQQGLGTALQGGQLGLSGIGTALQGQQLGLSGVNTQLAGTAQGMQGAQVGLQGVSGAQAGYGLANQAGANLSNIGTAQQQADLARLQWQNQIGSQQQQQEQNIINQAINNYAMAQNYPMQQLAGYNALLRGYATPTTTTQSYQATNPISQIGGLGLAAYGLSRKAGGPIKEKKFSTGGITSIDRKVLNNPFAFSAETIDRGIKSKMIDPMIGAIALSQLQNKPKAPAQAPQGTILSELEAQATQGIDQLPSNLPVTKAAGGGIIAFDNGGDIKGYDGTDGESQVKDPWGQGLVDLWKRYTWGSPEALQRQGAFTPEQAAKAREQENLIKKQVSEGNEAFLSGKLDKKPDAEKPGIVIHDNKKPNAPAAPPASRGVDYSQDYAGINDLLKEYTGLIRGAYQSPEEAQKQAEKNMYIGLGTRLMASKNPNLLGGLGEAGLGTLEEYQKALNKMDADKRAQVGQLVNLGLKGLELKQELKKLGITEDYYKAHAPLFAEQANYYRARAANPPGTAGGSIGSPTALKMWQEYKGQLADPVSSPVFKSLDKTTQKFLQKADPSSPSYKEAYKVFKKALDDEFGSSVQFMRAVGTKGQASTLEE